tara:strand:+ start:17 stop:2185 length:2169 start_codon:yes stop_codon:yes gene_type:complete
MTRGTDESEMVENCNLKKPGTQTEIFLKEHVRIDTLVNMVKTVASNYPVKTILEIINSEKEQTIASYKNTDEDTFEEYQPVEKFKDYVALETENKFVTLIDNDEMELYLSTVGGNRNSSYLCRIPIDISYDTGFTTYLNIKKEKIKGTDSKGRDKLQEVPKPDRDEVNEIAEGYFSKIIEKACDDMIHDIDIKNFNEYESSDKRWILNGYSVDDKLNHETHKFVQKMREPVRYRNVDGIQKRRETLLTLFGEHKTIMYHSSLHKGTYEAIHGYLKKQETIKWEKENPDSTEQFYPRPDLIIVDDTNDQPIIDAKQFKKDKKIKSVVTMGSSNSSKGLLVRDGSYNNYRIEGETMEQIKKRYPGGLYYADNLIDQHSISGIQSDNGKWINGMQERNKVGVIIAKKSKTLYPSVKVLFQKISDAAADGKIWHMKRRNTINQDDEQYVKTVFEHQTNDGKFTDGTEMSEKEKTIDMVNSIRRYFNNHYSLMLYPTQCKESMPYLKHTAMECLFVPTSLIHAIRLLTSVGNSYGSRETDLIIQARHVPQWTKWSNKASKFVWGKYFTFGGRYSEPNFKCRAQVMRWLVDIQDGVCEKPSEDEFDKELKEILSNHKESVYDYNLEYKKLFPVLHLEGIAKSKGFETTITKEKDDGTTGVFGYTKEMEGRTPIEINGRYYTVDNSGLTSYIAMIDNDGKPQLILRKNDVNITYHNDELHFIEEITEWH